MRLQLAKRDGQRDLFYGTFERFGTKSNWKTGKPEKTILLKDIRDNTGTIITDHLWFNYTKGFQRLGEIRHGDTIRFEARIGVYMKGYEKDLIDYKLTRPTKVVRIKANLFNRG